MKIANPLYDHAFKYLMSNDRLARKVLSVILDKEVLELELSQQEVIIADEERRFTMYRLDFKARIRSENGREETVLIELQKSKLPTNLLRFRSYLGLTYGQKPRITEQQGTPLPIISIYILGYNIEDIPIMAAKVDRRIVDMSKGEELHIKSDFIDLLTHTCYILQVRRLPPERQSRIEKFMTLFNQHWVQEHNFILDLEEVPEEFKDVAEYLRRPLQDEDQRNKLMAEEELEQLFGIQEAEKAALLNMIEEAKAREEEAKAREEEAKAREEEAKAREEGERRQKEEAVHQAREAKLKLARLMLRSGVSVEEIALETGLTKEEVNELPD
jgi:septum formation inhibitor MinC